MNECSFRHQMMLRICLHFKRCYDNTFN